MGLRARVAIGLPLRPVWARFRAEAATRKWSWSALVVLVGLAAGAVLGIAAGTRRTESAYPRFVASHSAGDFMVGNGFTGLGPSIDLGAVSRLPGIITTGTASFLPAVGRTDSGRRILPGDAATGAPADGHYSVTVDRWKLLAGRRANPHRLDEAVASFEFARQYDVHVGSTVRLRFLPASTAVRLLPGYLAGLTNRVAGSAGPVDLDALWDGPQIKVRVVGIEAAPFEFPPRGTVLPPLVMTRAFYDKYAAGLVREDIMHVRIAASSDRRVFHREIDRLAGGHEPPIFADRDVVTRDVQRSIRLEAVVLWVLAAMVGISALVILAQALSRQTYVEADDFPALSALGMTRRQLVAVGVLRAGTIGLLGSILGVGIAVAMSPIWPTGLARNAEPHPGLAFDWSVFAAGACAVTVFAVLIGAISTARLASHLRSGRSVEPGRTRASRLLHESGLPVPLAVGAQHALEPGRGRTAVPVRSAILATALAVGTIVVAATFASSTDNLLANPRLYGWSSDAEINTLTLSADPVIAGLERNPAVTDVAAGSGAQLEVDGETVNAVALDDVERSLPPDLVGGHPIRRDDQIVLGTQTLRDLGRRVGDRVRVGSGTHAVRMQVVGSALFAHSGDTVGELDQGAQITFTALRRLNPGATRTLVRFRVAPDANATSIASRIGAAVVPFPMHTPEPPTTITSFGQTNVLPAIVATVMLVLAVAALAHALVSSVRRRRRDFAILETLGCERRQLSAAVGATATTFACVACLVGVPLGLLGGRWAWAGIADVLGVPSEPTVSITVIAAIVVGMLLAANLIALVPAAIARRTRPAVALRVE